MSRMMQNKTHCYNKGAWREKKNARKLRGFTEAGKDPESMILEVKIFSDVAGMEMQRAGWLFS